MKRMIYRFIARKLHGTVAVAKPLLVLVVLMLSAIPSATAGNGDSYLGVSAGVLYPGILNVRLSAEREGAYHNAWEFFGEWWTQWEDCPTCEKVCRDSFFKSKYALSVGAAYKKTVSKSRNNFGRLRVGADLGTNTRGFMLGVELGYEHVWTLRSGMQVFVEQKNEFNFFAKPRFTNGLLVGVRLPL